MSDEARLLYLPAPEDLRTCSRWACPHRNPFPTGDPARLDALLTTVVREMADVAIQDIEVLRHARPTIHYRDSFVKVFFDEAVKRLPPAPVFHRAVLADAVQRGVMCLVNLVERVLPRLHAAELLLESWLPIHWTIPDGHGGSLQVPELLLRLGKDRSTGELRAYDWHIDHPCTPNGMSPLHLQQVGITLGWLQKMYPDQKATFVDVYLRSDVVVESTRSPEELRHLEQVLRIAADQQQAVRDGIWPTESPLIDHRTN